MNAWDEMRKQCPKFAAMLDMLQTSKFWTETCPSECCWHFVTQDGRYGANVIWRDHEVVIFRKWWVKHEA